MGFLKRMDHGSSLGTARGEPENHRHRASGRRRLLEPQPHHRLDRLVDRWVAGGADQLHPAHPAAAVGPQLQLHPGRGGAHPLVVPERLGELVGNLRVVPAVGVPSPSTHSAAVSQSAATEKAPPPGIPGEVEGISRSLAFGGQGQRTGGRSGRARLVGWKQILGTEVHPRRLRLLHLGGSHRGRRRWWLHRRSWLDRHQGELHHLPGRWRLTALDDPPDAQPDQAEHHRAGGKGQGSPLREVAPADEGRAHFTSGLVASPTVVMFSRPSRSRTSTNAWYCTWPSPRTTTGNSGVTAFCWVRRCSSSLRLTGMVSRKIFPSWLTVIALVVGLARLFAGLALGRLTFIPCTVAVVMITKMTSSTYARSSIGVMLMSS